MAEETRHSLKSLIAAPKGNLLYKEGNAFLLHVFWEAPSMEAAEKLLEGLRKCANASHRDTPCVPTYFFRISSNNQDLCSSKPKFGNDIPSLRAAIRKLLVGIPEHAVHAELIKRGLDPALLEVGLDSELPEHLQQQPIAVEFSEVYLDERAFMEHAGSRDYLDGYGVVMDPSLHFSVPQTMRLGTPTAYIVEGILEPILKESVVPVESGCFVWKPLSTTSIIGSAMFLSLEFNQDDVTDATGLVTRLPDGFIEICSTCLCFVHPLRPNTVRLMAVMHSLPPTVIWGGMQLLHPARGEIHMQQGSDAADDVEEAVRAALQAAGMEYIILNGTESVGYILHARAAEIRVGEY